MKKKFNLTKQQAERLQELVESEINLLNAEIGGYKERKAQILEVVNDSFLSSFLMAEIVTIDHKASFNEGIIRGLKCLIDKEEPKTDDLFYFNRRITHDLLSNYHKANNTSMFANAEQEIVREVKCCIIEKLQDLEFSILYALGLTEEE